MNKFYIRYHIKGGNRVLTREVENYDINDVLSEVLYDLKNNSRVLFKKNPDTLCGIFVDSISFFEIQTEKEYKMMQDMDGLSNLMKGALK